MSVTAVLTPRSSIQAENKHIFPLIADNSFNRIGSGAIAAGYSGQDGLLANSNVSAALLSMSGYSKAAYSEPKDPEYQTSQPLQQAMYVAYPQPGAVQPHLQSHSASYGRHGNQVSYAAGGLFDNRARIQDSGPYLTEATREQPQVQSWKPQQGPQGTMVFIFLASAFELDPSWRLEAEFGSRKCVTTQRKLVSQDSYHQYALTTEVPHLSLTGWPGPHVPVRIAARDQSENVIASIKLNPGFVYTDSSLPQLPDDLPKKRRLSDESIEAAAAPLKRRTTQHGRTESAESYQSQGYSYLQQSNPSYLQQSPHLSLDTSINNVLPAYQRAQTHSSDSPQDSPQRLPQQIPSATPTSAPVRGRSPHTPSWNVSNPNGGVIPKSPGVTVPGNGRVATLASPSMIANPPLIRTSTLQQSPSPANTPSGTSAPSSFNPYAMYPHKAILKINGSLDSMTEGWNEEEREVKRRLVQFWRSQAGSTISTDFKPVAPEDRQPNSICINCIWWESRNEYYVTSVDTIYLLESLVAVRFTVEEKNRIRRNLEGFRPMTVSKGKSDSEDFFKLIMGFPNPKPRNIEKDVKVFPWKILSHALKKIISKYSASYSSTAGALSTTINSNFRAPQAQDLGSDLQLPASPHSTAESSIGVAYQSPMTATTMSNEVSLAQTTSPYASASPAIMPTTMAPATYPLYSYPQAHLHHTTGTMSLTAHQASQHQRPPSWDFAPFMEPTSVASGSGLYAVDPAQSASQYQMTHTSSSA